MQIDDRLLATRRGLHPTVTDALVLRWAGVTWQPLQAPGGDTAMP